MRILVVDDDRDTTTTQVMLLKLHGYEAHGCNRGADAVALIEQLRPDVVVLDLSMPMVTGYDIANELRKRPDIRPHCLIAVSGYGPHSEHDKTAAAGFDYHLDKPVEFKELEMAINP